MIILTGASASGKTEVAHSLARHYGIAKAITTTSRLPREGEKDGIDYFFVSKEKFLSLIEKGNFVEHTLYNGHYYGTGKSQVSDDKCLVVDPNGLKSFLALDDPSVVSFILLAKEKTREERMGLRGDKPEDIQRRILGDRTDFAESLMPKTDYTIVTDTRSIDSIAEEVYLKYQEKLRIRGLKAK